MRVLFHISRFSFLHHVRVFVFAFSRPSIPYHLTDQTNRDANSRIHEKPPPAASRCLPEFCEEHSKEKLQRVTEVSYFRLQPTAAFKDCQTVRRQLEPHRRLFRYALPPTSVLPLLLTQHLANIIPMDSHIPAFQRGR